VLLNKIKADTRAPFMQKIEHNNFAWINLANPPAKDLLFLKDTHRVSSNVLQQLITPIKRPKIEEYPGYLFLVLHFPVFYEKDRQTIPTELDFIITREAIITVYPEPVPSLVQFFEDCSHHLPMREEYFQTTGYLLFCILDKLIDSCLPMLDHVQEKIDDTEDKIFKGQEKEMLSEVAIIKRDIIDFRRTIKPQRSVLEILSKKSSRFFNQDLDFISQEVIGSNIRVWNTLENHKEMIEAIEKTNESLFSYKISEIVKVLTILSFITFPLNLVTGFLGMSLFENVPFMHSPFAYLYVLAAELIIGLLLITFFRKKKWL
jgi:magnesium transporter